MGKGSYFSNAVARWRKLSRHLSIRSRVGYPQMVRSTQEIISERNAQILRRIDYELLERFLFAHLGLPYIWGGDDPILGFDCSGLAVEMLISFGRKPPGFDTNAQGLYAEYIQCASSVPKLGALIFYGASPTEVEHVGIGLNSWQMIEAGGGGRSTTTEKKAAAQNAYSRVRSVYDRKDYLGSANPFYLP